MIWVIIIALAIALDQATKWLVVNNMDFNSSITIINNFFNITYWENRGAAWGIFQNGRYFFIPLTIIISIALVYVMFKYNSKFLRISLCFILGGAVGNLIDRIFRGSVVDFFQFFFGTYEFPIFNVADSFVVIGSLFMAYYVFFIYKDKESNDEEKDKALE